MEQGARTVARPLDLSGRNARLARPFFHPPVAFRGHFSQRHPTLPQHLAQGHSHRGLCNCHPRFIHARFSHATNSHPVAYSHLLPLPPGPPFPRVLFRSRIFISREQKSKLRAAAPPDNLRRATATGLSINYGQFSTLAFIYATPETPVVNATRAEHTAGYCKYLTSPRSHVADLSPSFPRRAYRRSLSPPYFKW